MDYWVLVWMPSGEPIPPNDCNPGQTDQGMMVYRSKSAALKAAAHQDDLYGAEDVSAAAIPLSQLGLKVS